MRRFLQKTMNKPVTWLANTFGSRPNRERVHAALTKLYNDSKENPGRKVLVIDTDVTNARFIILSDQHKGAKNGSDDFMVCEHSYMTALEYYYEQGFHFISLGDEEELWENTVWPVKANNKESTALQKKFLQQQRFTKVYGNHDTFWNNDPFAGMHLKSMYDGPVKIYEAVVLQLKAGESKVTIFLTHGHQGDGQSDSNWFSAWFTGRVWAPLQSYLNLNPNVPSASDELKTAHNLFMYQWSEQEHNPVLITGHTHQPVFASLTHLENLYKKLAVARSTMDEVLISTLNKKIRFKQNEFDFVIGSYSNMKPYYFNSGCCCFMDGDITGIEIADGMIRLIKWNKTETNAERIVLDEMELKELI
ncbi:MAG: metallophosphoesterase family protein [Chitinophagaceae bacterium]|nr:metallophosphoesterase family protein [Chitinophagaceae bacterium]